MHPSAPTASPDDISDVLQQLQSLSGAAAIDLLANAVTRRPGDARLLVLLAAEFMEQRDTDRAEAAYQAALQIAPGFAIARFQLGLLQFTGARPAVALVTWAPLDQLPDEDPLRLFKQAFASIAAGDNATAREYLVLGMAANVANPPLNHDMQLVLDRLGAPEAPENAPTEEAHVLLAAYKGGALH